MMDEVFKTHKETTFGWLLMLQEWKAHAASRRAAAARRRSEVASAPAPAKPMRFLAPR
jgi:hypothetical protein